MPHTAESLEAGEVPEPLLEICSTEVYPPNDAEDKRMAFGEAQQEARLVLGLVGLHCDRPVDPVRRELCL